MFSCASFSCNSTSHVGCSAFHGVNSNKKKILNIFLGQAIDRFYHFRKLILAQLNYCFVSQILKLWPVVSVTQINNWYCVIIVKIIF